jgi:5,10-methylenetetrahydromethanopterin reductase
MVLSLKDSVGGEWSVSNGRRERRRPSMKISLGVYPNETPLEIIQSARLAESLKFNTLWMLDSHLLFREVYAMLGALAVSTTSLRLGTAVTNPITRHPTVTASAFSTLHALTNGRATLGISVGDSALKAMNLKIAKMATLADAVVRIRALFKGDAVSFSGDDHAKLTFAGVDLPIYIAATGPKMLKMSGELADGVILMNGIAPKLIRTAVDIVRDAEQAAGRPEGSTKIVVWAACHPSFDAVKYNVARAILRNIPGSIDDLTRKVAAEVRAAYNYEQHGRSEAKFSKLIPDELVSRYAFAGSAQSIKEQVDALRPLGVDEVVLAIPVAPGIKSRDEVMRELAPALI